MIPSRLAVLVVVCLGSVPAVAQTPRIDGVTNSANFQTRLAPGSQAAVFGINLGPNGVAARPTDPSISIGGRPAYVYFASAQQVNFQVPVELPPGPTTLVLTYQSRSSAPFAITLLAYAPAVLAFSTGGAGAFQHADGSLVGPTPARPGETLACALTGLGQTNPAVRTGQTTPGSPLSVALVTPEVSVGGKPAQVQFAGLAPGLIGAYQMNFTVPGDLAPGLYNVVVNSGGVPSAPVLLPVAITGLVLDRTGITFDAAAAGPVPPSAPLVAYVTARQTTFVTATVATTTGGNWLTATLANGSTFLTSLFNISVNPAALSPGVYYGQVRFSTPDAANSPQFATIVLRVAPPASPPLPVVDPTGVTFLDVAGSTRVTSQTVTLTNVGTQPVSFTAATASTTTPNPFSVPSTTGTLAPGLPLRFTVQANTTVPTAGGIGAGSYRGTLTFTFPQGTRAVDLLFVATPAGTANVPSGASPPLRTWESAAARQAGCTPARLAPVFRALGAGFTAPVGWPAVVEVNVIDDCGTPMATGSVVASFSNGDVPLSLVGDGSGKWSATWTPINTVNRATTVTALAAQPDLGISGQAIILGSVADNPNVPVISPGGVVDAASFNAASTPSPGQIVGVFGGQFANGLSQAPALPLPNNLSGTELVIGGRSVPLIFVSPGQINAVLPYGLTTTSPTQMVAIRGNTISTPVPVSVVASAPGVFATDGTGRGQGHVYVATGGAGTLADSRRPLGAGDVIIIYCGGLGEVDVPVEAGTATPVDALRNARNSVSLTIGGVRAAVSFAGLTPGAAGLYQINATVPSGVPSGAAVPMVVTIGAVSSLPVMVAVQ